MGRPRMTICSLLVASLCGCSAAIPIQDGTGAPKKKLVVDAEWSVKQPTAELLAAVRDGHVGELSDQTQPRTNPSPRAPLAPSDVQAVASVPPSTAAPPIVTHHLDTVGETGESIRPRRSNTLERALQTSMLSEGPGIGKDSATGNLQSSDQVPPESTPAARLGRAAAVDQPSVLPATDGEPHSAESPQGATARQGSKPATESLEAHDLRLKALACDAHGEAVAQLELPDHSVLFVRPGQRLQLASAEAPADVRIGQIDGAQVKLQFNGSPQVLTLR